MARAIATRDSTSTDRAGRSGRRRLRLIVFPAVVVCIAVAFTIAGISGSSVGTITQLTAPKQPVKNLIAGTPKAIRSDEWYVATPLIVAQSHRGFGRITSEGIGKHDLIVSVDVPTTDWSTFFKPWDLPMLILDVVHGFAARWWMMSVIFVLGVYLLIAELTRRIDIAILFAMGMYVSPFFQWWYEAITFESVGMAAFAVALFLIACRVRGRMSRLALLGLASYATISFTLLLYPPFQVPIAIVMGSISIAEVTNRVRSDYLKLAQVGHNLLLISLMVVPVALIFYVSNKSAILAINGTVYPGDRRVAGGHTSLYQLLSAPFGYFLAKNGSDLVTTNQSEISSFILFAPFIALQLFRLRLSEWPVRSKRLLIGATIGTALVAMWYLIGLPPIVAAVLLLNRAEPNRALIGVGVGGFFMAAFYAASITRVRQELDARLPAHAKRTHKLFGSRTISGGGVGGLCAFVVYFWAGQQFMQQFPQLKLSLWICGALAGTVGVIVALILAGRVWSGAVGLVLFGAFISMTVNPLYQGLGPLANSSIQKRMVTLAQNYPSRYNSVWVSYADAPMVNAVVLASGVNTVNAVDVYPDASAWRRIVPKGTRHIWNRYANLYFAPLATGQKTQVKLVVNTVIRVSFSPCGATADQLHIGFVASTYPITAKCLVSSGEGRIGHVPVYLYRRTGSH